MYRGNKPIFISADIEYCNGVSTGDFACIHRSVHATNILEMAPIRRFHIAVPSKQCIPGIWKFLPETSKSFQGDNTHRFNALQPLYTLCMQLRIMSTPGKVSWSGNPDQSLTTQSAWCRIRSVAGRCRRDCKEPAELNHVREAAFQPLECEQANETGDDGRGDAPKQRHDRQRMAAEDAPPKR